MEIPVFLAFTAAELSSRPLGAHWGYLGCRFSASGLGLGNIPRSLPEGGMLIVTDSTDAARHDPALVTGTLLALTETFRCESVLLDFQKPGNPEALSIAQAVVAGLSCPVGVSEHYAETLPCPVLVSPIPPDILPQEHLQPWSGREIWLELSREGRQIHVDGKGSRYSPLPHHTPTETALYDGELCCHYEIRLREDSICFSLGRTYEDLTALLEKAKHHGVTRGVGLWQELG